MPRQSKPLNDKAIQALKPKDKRYRVTHGDGLLLEVMPSGSKIWRYRYQIGEQRYPAFTIGSYPEVSLADAKIEASKLAAEIKRGIAPRDKKAKEKAAKQETFLAFAETWMASDEFNKNSESYRSNTRRIMQKDVLPLLGEKPLKEVKREDIRELCNRIKSRGSPKQALLTLNAVKRLYNFAIDQELADINPAALLTAKYIAEKTPRTRVLSPHELGLLVRTIYKSDIRRVLKLALHLLVITMVRKVELTEAVWSEFDLIAGVWDIPAERMKKDSPHRVYLSKQALDILEELRGLSGHSAYLFPTGRGDADKPIHSTTLNTAVRALSLDMPPFVLHDFRRTASTHLHEMGHPSDAIEKLLAHEVRGIKGVYNRAEYSEQRRIILQAWADFVESQITGGNVVPLFRVA